MTRYLNIAEFWYLAEYVAGLGAATLSWSGRRDRDLLGRLDNDIVVVGRKEKNGYAGVVLLGADSTAVNSAGVGEFGS